MSRQRVSGFILLFAILIALLIPEPSLSQTQDLDAFIHAQTEEKIYQLYDQIESDWSIWLESQEAEPLAFTVIVNSPNLLINKSCIQDAPGERTANYCKFDKQIVIDSFFANYLLQGVFLGEHISPPNEIILAFAIAHEFGHGYLRSMGYLNLMESSSPAEEQAADCLGGVWLGWQIRNGGLVESELSYVVTFIESMGNSPTINQATHGSAAERNTAVQIGIDSANPYTCVDTYLTK